MNRLFRHFIGKNGFFSENRLTKAVFEGIFPLEFLRLSFGQAKGFKLKCSMIGET
ncbi:MAG: hypothetical protein PUK29_06380 [Fibrobacter sp.]|uniref:hypothetical protein n=1 Tax=Fibrobacter sp. TaxID=35828 RepID=UPI0025C16897|nr:hypothetical protein [Fibrobacter sp.]MCI6438014.1 hypothetical protein [Fibrobacter sp.]MDD7497871.1 hypothetical protein [Fibrobacter sp.]MDY5723813.1 hypothetical protein [Fibrobacter sp.]